MSRTNEMGADGYRYRVAYAAKVIAEGREATRNFCNCFENCDGELVAVALARRAERNPKIARNLGRYLNAEYMNETVARFAHVPTRDLARYAVEAQQAREAKRRAAYA